MHQAKVLLVLLVAAIFVAGVSANKPRKFKKAIDQKKHYLDIKQNLEKLLKEEDQLENELEEQLDIIDEDDQTYDDYQGDEAEEEEEEENDDDDDDYGPHLPQYVAPEEEDEDESPNPCETKHCGPGKECIINDQGEGECQCLSECLEIYDARRKVCSNYNDTWPSDCQLHRMRCLCASGDQQCIDVKYKHVHIDYYGNCQKISSCQEEEMEDFPRRMREWLFNIMRDMADREELSQHYMKLEKIAEEDEQKKWSMAAVWKWCTLDDKPKDSAVSRHELFPLRAPLYALEHCISPFLDSCDINNDHKVSLQEWIDCLELTEEHKDDLEDLCEDIRDQE